MLFHCLLLGISLLSGPFASASPAIPRELEPVFERLVLHTDEGRRLAEIIAGREVLVREGVDAHRLLQRALRADRDFALRLRGKLEKLSEHAPWEASDWLISYREFAGSELQLDPNSSKILFLPPAGPSSNYAGLADAFTAGVDPRAAQTTQRLALANTEFNRVESEAERIMNSNRGFSETDRIHRGNADRLLPALEAYAELLERCLVHLNTYGQKDRLSILAARLTPKSAPDGVPLSPAQLSRLTKVKVTHARVTIALAGL
jgi:hypothetical protein